MNYNCIIITGTDGAGKSAISTNLLSRYDKFSLINTLDGIITITNIEGKIRELSTLSKIPILVISTDILIAIERNDDLKNKLKSLSIFLDAPDGMLDQKLSQRGESINEATLIKRKNDRITKGICVYTVYNLNECSTTELIWSLWNYQMTGGVLSKRLIALMLDCDMLLKNAEPENITSAAYDLSLGDEYYYAGKIRELTDKEPFILIEPYDYAIVTSKEIANLPRDMIGRFDLSVSLFCQGIILSNGPQVDPGFKGRLFCLLFNTSNALISLKRGQHYATLEFDKLIEPSESYGGKYQDKDKIIYYLPSNPMRGAINELKKEVEQVKKESKNLQNIFLAITSLILAIIALLLLIK